MTTHHNYIVIPIIFFRTGEELQTRTYTGPFWAFSFFFFFCFFFFSTLLSVIGNPAKKSIKSNTRIFLIFVFSWWQQQILSSWVCILQQEYQNRHSVHCNTTSSITSTNHMYVTWKGKYNFAYQYLMDDAWQHLS